MTIARKNINGVVRSVVRSVVDAGSPAVAIPTDYESRHLFSTDFSDETGNHNGQTIGSPSIVDNKLSLNGSSAIQTTNIYPATSKVFVSAIIKSTDQTVKRAIFADGDGGNATMRVSLWVDNNFFYISIGDGAAFYSNSTVPNTMALNTEYELQYIIDGTSVIIKVDGIEVANLTSTVALSTASPNAWHIGRLGAFAGFYWVGTIKDVIRYDYIPTAEEQAAITARFTG